MGGLRWGVAAVALFCAVSAAGCAASSGTARGGAAGGGPGAAQAGAAATIPSHCVGIMPALQAAFQFDESYSGDYNDPAKFHLPHDMASYMAQNIDSYPGLECAVLGLMETSSPLTEADIQIRPYDSFWFDNLLFKTPTPSEHCADLHIPGELRSQGCWSSDGTYFADVATPKVMIMGQFTLYQANDKMSELRDAVSRDLTRIAASV